MAIRFYCERCAYRIQLDSSPANSIACPSCRAALRPQREVSDIQALPLVRAALAPLAVVVPSYPRPALRDNPLVRYAAIGAAGAIAFMLIAAALAWTAFSKPRSHGTIATTNPLALSSTEPERETPPLNLGSIPEPEQSRPTYISPVIPETKKNEPEPVSSPEQPVPAMKPDLKEPAMPKPAVFKRRDKSSEEDLRKQLQLVREVSLDSVPRTSAQMQTLAQKMAKTNDPFQGPAVLLAKRPDLQGLPLRMGVDCQVGKEPAEKLQVLSRKMRVELEKSIPKNGIDVEPNAKQLRAALLDEENEDWRNPAAVPCLLQLLQAENSPVRLVMVEVLGKIQDKRATEALAMRAMMDLNPEVRELAARQLPQRPREDYEPLLLAGLRYPWAPVALHAAEVLAFVQDTGAIPQLVALLDQPDPSLAFFIRQGTKQTPMIREVVRINHLSNCLMCHPASFARNDLVRGAVPTPGQPLPAPSTPSQYYDNGAIFVHADTTYLKQDFSVMQPVPQHGEWPEHQRFDYLVRTRQAGLFETEILAQKARDGHAPTAREAVLFALRELTGQDRGTTAHDWKAVIEPKSVAITGFSKLEESVGSDGKQFVVSAFNTSDTTAESEAQRLKKAMLTASRSNQLSMLEELCDAKGVAYTDVLAELIGQFEDATVRARARELLVCRLERMNDTTLHDRLHDDEAELRAAAALAAARRNAKSLIPALVLMMADDNEAVVQAARTALSKLTDEDFGPPMFANSAERVRAADAWKAWWRKKNGE